MILIRPFNQVLRRYEVAIVNNPQPLKLRDPISFISRDVLIRFTERESVNLYLRKETATKG